jgi:hypothetical protein
MEILILSQKEDRLKEIDFLSFAMMISSKISKELHFYPISKTRKQAEVSIGNFSESEENLTFYIERGSADGLSVFSVANQGNSHFDVADPSNESLFRLGIVLSDNIELLTRFCKEYLNFFPNHFLSLEGRVDNFFDPEIGLLSLSG